jgi:hypothetical protein
MKYRFDNSTNPTSGFIEEEYIPATIEYSSEELNNHFIEFNYKDSDMLEMAVNPKSKILKRVSLILCNHYSFENATMPIPDADEGCLYIEDSDTTECDTFITRVYLDGIEIILSNNASAKYYRCGNIIFSMDASDTLVSVHFIKLSPQDINHVKNELSS